jgi:dolichol-phosphate mannosyltransferase
LTPYTDIEEPKLTVVPPAKRRLPTRMVKFAVVGGIGVLVNLLVLAFIQEASGTRAWWTSLIANFVATLHNYVVNNIWTFRDCKHEGGKWLRGAILYFAVATIGIGLTTFCYGLFTGHLARQLLRQAIGTVPAWYALASQLVAIGIGTCLNYFLNKTINWRLDTQPLE